MNKGPVLQNHSRIGIINRGEAAMRFIRAAQEYNSLNGTSLSTAAFYIDAENEALFAKEADTSIALSSLPSFAAGTGSPYLNKSLMIEALKTAECDAVWVGWGFVSEDAEFVEMVEKEGLVFLGPDSKAMALLGDKIAAKELCETSNVPILAWSRGPVRSVDEARTHAQNIGYPCIVKAANAGGGRGIRFVHTPEELERQFNSAREETVRITGDDIVFIERLVENGRHLEVQCLSDRHGTVHTFGVRDCSVQRRNQKIIEETPPPGFAADKIAEIEAAAQRLMVSASYESAGTVEFLYDIKSEDFIFMEVNTRLQVEHPITEQLYTVDLVKGQIDVAFGNKLPEERAVPRGAVMEVRLNAEDPDRDFTPSPGRVVRYTIPSGPGIRVDSGIEHGSVIPTDFDSMIGKIIASGPTRHDAIARLKRALGELRIKIEGGTTNRAFLLDLLSTEEVLRGGVHTRFVEELLAQRRTLRPRTEGEVALVATAIEQYITGYREELANFRGQLSSGGYPREVSMSNGKKVTLSADGTAYDFLIKALGNNNYLIEHNDVALMASYVEHEHESLLTYQNSRYRIQMVDRGDALQCEVEGVPYSIEIESGGAVKAPSPSLVLSIAVEPGQTVKRGDILLSLEAMKMEMVVEAPDNGTVKEILVRKGEQVAAGQELLQLELGEAGPEEPKDASVQIVFTPPPETPAAHWELLEREYYGLFLGFDHRSDAGALLQGMLKIAAHDDRFRIRMIQLIGEAVKMYADLEMLYDPTPLTASGFARAASSQELLMHYFKRRTDAEKGLPESFLANLRAALQRFSLSSEADEERSLGVLHRIYKSHAALATKRMLLHASLFALEQHAQASEVGSELSNALDRVAYLAQQDAPGLADSAIHARYHFVDRELLEIIREEKIDKVTRTLDRLSKEGAEPRITERAISNLVNSGQNLLGELVKAVVNGDTRRRELALMALGRRYSRDRELSNENISETSGLYVFRAEYSDVQGSGNTVTAVSRVAGTPDSIAALSEYLATTGPASEALLLQPNGDPNIAVETVVSILNKSNPAAEVVILCPVAPDGSRLYRSFIPGEDGWQEDESRFSFSPLAYRELRVYRLVNFNTKVLHYSDGIRLLQLNAKSNPKDERLIALAEVPSSRIEFDGEGRIVRMIGLEKVLMEAVYAIRAEQAKRKRRLHWNRIIIHNRSVMQTTLEQVQDYAARLAARVTDLGLEKSVLYSRRPKQEGAGDTDQIVETELLFENISGTNFTMRRRTPSLELLKPIDGYAGKVIRARQRGNLYPYEIIKMVTRTGFPVSETYPRGEFEEYDLDPQAPEKAVSVKGRPYGENASNLVFGIITNQLSSIPTPLRRVIILSDPTVDMGSLAEPECRRINAALDMAEAEGIPVEWLPISGGAKIDMESGTENLDWTARTVRRIIEFTQAGGEINIIVAGINVGAQSYWNAEATMLMHTRGLLIMTEDASMLLTGKKALDFSGSVSAENNVGVGGVEKIMGPNGQAQLRVKNLYDAYSALYNHYAMSYSVSSSGSSAGKAAATKPASAITSGDPSDRDITEYPYNDPLGQGFTKVGDIFSLTLNPERKKAFEMRQVMSAVKDQDVDYCERWLEMKDAETAIVWETRLGGHPVGLIGIESRSLARLGEIPHDGPESWSGGTLFPQSSKKVARALNAFSGRVPAVILANLSGFDGSPESLRKLQLEYGAEIGRAVVNFKGPIVFVITARYHGGAYVVFSKALNSELHAVAIEGSYASVIGGAPAAAVVFPRAVTQDTEKDPRVQEAGRKLKEDAEFTQLEYNEVYQQVHAEKQAELATRFDKIHSVERAKQVGSIDEIIPASQLRQYVIGRLDG